MASEYYYNSTAYVWFFLKNLLVNDSFWRSDPGFLFWGRRLVSPGGTVSRADMVWTDAMLAVLRCQVQQTPPRRPRAAAAALRAPQTTAPLQNVGQNRALREILLEKIVHSESRNMSHTEKYFLYSAPTARLKMAQGWVREHNHARVVQRSTGRF